MSGAPKGFSGFERVLLLHGALVLLTAGALQLPGGPPWFLTAPANLLLLLTLPSLVLAPLEFGRRRLLSATLQLASAAVGLGFFLAPALEELSGSADLASSPIRSESEGFRIVTFNTGVGLASGERITQFLQQVNPDIVVLVEVSERLARELDSLLPEQFSQRVFHPDGIDGKAVLSRFPIRSSELLRLEDGRPALRVALDLDGEPLELLAVHFSPSMGIVDRGAAAGRDLDRWSATLNSAGRTIMAGDFNTTERSPSHARLVALGFTDSFAEVGTGLGTTFPIFGRYFGLPIGRFMRIDYVWHGAALRAERAWVGPDLGSDHLPVVVDLVSAKAQ